MRDLVAEALYKPRTSFNLQFGGISFVSNFLNHFLLFLLEPDVMEAIGQYDFVGRTERELSFKKGDTLVVFKQVSADWWEGAYKGKEGLIPDKYIVLKSR